MATFNSPLMLLALFSILRTHTVLGILVPLRKTCELSPVRCAQDWAVACVQGSCGGEYWLPLLPTQGYLHYLHLLHLHHHQQLPCLLRAPRHLPSSRLRLWMAWAEGPCSALSRISKKELWGKPKPVITVLRRSAEASCLHLEGKVLFYSYSPLPPKLPSSWENNCWASTATNSTILQMLM